MNSEAKLAELGLKLPPTSQPAGLYKPLLIVGNVVRVSGHGPLQADGTLITGQVGAAEAGLEFGKAAARQAGLAILATIRDRLGSLDRIRRVIHLLGMVYAASDFAEHPQVINGCSELFAEVFGADNGIGTRSAVGVSSLPGRISVEIESTFELVF